MPRIPYKPNDIAEPKELVESIRARRGGRLLHLDRMLLHSPALATGWNVYLGAVRNALTLPPKLRELAVCVVAVLNGAEYEFHHHAPEFVKYGGTPAQVEALRRGAAASIDAAAFNAAERALIQITTEMTRGVDVSDATFRAMRAMLADDRQMVELIGIVATYNMVSRFLVALHIEPES